MRTYVLMSALALGAAGMVAAAPADAQQRHHGGSSWRTIGYKTVSGGVDTDRITVQGHARYRQVRLCVFNAPIVMRDFDVRFENGGHQDVRVRQRIGAGTCTRNIDLAGNRRDIETVRLKYSPIRRGWTRPLVRVHAS